MTSDQRLNDPAYLSQATTDYLNNQTGPLTNVGGEIIGAQFSFSGSQNGDAENKT